MLSDDSHNPLYDRIIRAVYRYNRYYRYYRSRVTICILAAHYSQLLILLLTLTGTYVSLHLTAKLTKHVIGNNGCTIGKELIAEYPFPLHAVCVAWRQECLPSWADEDFDFC